MARRSLGRPCAEQRRGCQYPVRGTRAWPAGVPLDRQRTLEVLIGFLPALEDGAEHPEIAVGGAEARETEHDGEAPPRKVREQLVERRRVRGRAGSHHDLGEHAEGRPPAALVRPFCEVLGDERVQRPPHNGVIACLEVEERERRPRIEVDRRLVGEQQGQLSSV